jgi:hypothetical protein
MKRGIIAVIVMLLVALFLLSLIVFIFLKVNSGSKDAPVDEYPDREDDYSDEDIEQGSEDLISRGGGSSYDNKLPNPTSSVAIDNEEDNQTGDGIPLDLYTAECGKYYDDYGICTGTCPDGRCIEQGKSCYCQINQ